LYKSNADSKFCAAFLEPLEVFSSDEIIFFASLIFSFAFSKASSATIFLFSFSSWSFCKGSSFGSSGSSITSGSSSGSSIITGVSFTTSITI